MLFGLVLDYLDESWKKKREKKRGSGEGYLWF